MDERKVFIPPKPPLPAHGVAARASAHTATGHTSGQTMRVARLVLTIYASALALIAIWPMPVDGGAGPLLRGITRVFPFLTYARIEFGANILLFVPLGALLALLLTRRYLIMPIALVATVSIESMQALMLERRTPSVMDILANLAGACIGLLIVAGIEWWRRRRQ
ncbi:VanZ family protein [Microbacterium lacus]|uniref:VanZ family protein n=1 Tax=Microbacterium lacus TaxID=415217 RepID=UPI00384D1037